MSQLDYLRDCLCVWLTDNCMPRQSNVNSSLRADAGGRQVTQTGASGLVRVSAGELLGRTHEELVLLLIQLRRQNATVLKAMETCHMEIEAQVRREFYTRNLARNFHSNSIIHPDDDDDSVVNRRLVFGRSVDNEDAGRFLELEERWAFKRSL